MLFRNHVEELDHTAAELRGRLFNPQAQRALASDAGIPEPVLDAPGIVVAHQERLNRLVVSAVGADMPDRGAAVIPAFTPGGSTV
jgi:hypothetical protein